MYSVLIFFFLCVCLDCNGVIVPQELPSVLSVVYSVIPPIRKGTDSRLGFGFRLGNHADFQTILEIGPQKNTKPLGTFNSLTKCAMRHAVIHFGFDFSIAGKSDSDDSGTSKRMADQVAYEKPIKVRKNSPNP